MKFISWNVNGLRAICKKGFTEIFNNFNADFICLQETKLQEGDISLAFDGYQSYWNYAQKKGYSGTVIFTTHTPQTIHYGLDIKEYDKEGRVITLEYINFFLVNVYVPNSQDKLRRINYRMQWEDVFCSYVTKLNKIKSVIICGDMNVAHEEIDLKNPSTNHENAGFTDMEREKMTNLLNSGFTDSFRYFFPNKTGEYTWWSYRGNARSRNTGWRIDYFLVSQDIKEKMTGVAIYKDVLGSDHCPIELQITDN